MSCCCDSRFPAEVVSRHASGCRAESFLQSVLHRRGPSPPPPCQFYMLARIVGACAPRPKGRPQGAHRKKHILASRAAARPSYIVIKIPPFNSRVRVRCRSTFFERFCSLPDSLLGPSSVFQPPSKALPRFFYVSSKLLPLALPTPFLLPSYSLPTPFLLPSYSLPTPFLLPSWGPSRRLQGSDLLRRLLSMVPSFLLRAFRPSFLLCSTVVLGDPRAFFYRPFEAVFRGAWGHASCRLLRRLGTSSSDVRCAFCAVYSGCSGLL